jgi:RNA polymerase sigma-70 factor (sigma-E family)
MARRDDEEYVEFATAAQPRLRRTAYLLCGDWHRASDLAQEALIRVYVAWPRLQRNEGLHAYARKALVSAAIDHGRKRSSKELPVAEHSDHGGGDFSGHLASRDVLLDALRELAPRQRACVVLRYFEDLPVAEVAQVLGCTEGTVKSQTSRALDSLRQTLDSLELGEVTSW